MALGDFLRKVADELSGDNEKQRRGREPQEGLFDQVLDAVTGRDRDPRTDPRIRPASEDPLGDPADQIHGRNVRPASEAPLGDPADLERARQIYGRDVLPASQDPLGDPADQLAGRDIRPASEDPLGDPADGPPRRRRRGLF